MFQNQVQLKRERKKKVMKKKKKKVEIVIKRNYLLVIFLSIPMKAELNLLFLNTVKLLILKYQ